VAVPRCARSVITRSGKQAALDRELFVFPDLVITVRRPQAGAPALVIS